MKEKGEHTLPENIDAPQVFMSYSHDDEAHRAWVLQLSTRLRSNGVDVCLDRWNVTLGGITKRQASGVYGFLCAGTHPSLYQAKQWRQYVDHGDHVGTVLSVGVRDPERLLFVPVAAYDNALSYTISFYGLDRTAHEELTGKVAEIMPGALA